MLDIEKVVGGSINVICGSVFYSKKLDIQKMAEAANELFKINDALRIRLVQDGTIVHQQIAEFKKSNIEVVRVKNKEHAHEYAKKQAQIPFDMSKSLCEIKIIEGDTFCFILYKLHHIIADAWTLSLIATQFNRIMNSQPAEAFSYADIIEADSKYLLSKRYLKDRDFYIQQFSDNSEPVLFSEKNVETLSADRKTFTFSKDSVKSIQLFSKNNSISTALFFLSVISVLFSKTHNNCERFYIGLPVVNRMGPKEKNTAGLFINTAPISIKLNNDSSFLKVTEDIEEAMMSTMRHQKYTYEDISSSINSEFSFKGSLYDVIFSYQNAQIAGDDFESTWYHNGIQRESLQIHIDDRDDKGILKIHYDYQTDKFSERDIDLIHSHFCNLIFDVLENPNKKIVDIEMLSTKEKHGILVEFNNTAVDYSKDKCIHELFEEQAAKTPDKTAVIATDKTLTYKDLNEEANKIAHSLMKRGVSKGDIVGLMLPRKSYLLSALLGILKTGAAYLPIDSELPAERIEYMCKDTNAAFVISDKNIYSLLETDNMTNPNIEITNDSVCYCIYTSGSTGQPKGVLAMHRNVVNYISKNEHNIAGKIITDGFEAIVSISTCSFDIFVTETLLPLVNGLRTVLADEEQCRNQYALNKLLSKEKGEFLQTTPTKFKALTADPTQRGFLKNIKAILLGGEAMEKTYLEELKRITNAKIYNIYGATEVPIWSTFADTKTFVDEITIGKPIANTQVYILDKYLKPVPIGVMGELCIAGDSVSAGYLNRPEQTAEKFIDNPFGKGKLYKTGDNAYWREDGNIVYVGRSDFQVKIRGLRIELGEIESVLQAVKGVDRAVVVVRKDKSDRQLICAFYTGEEIASKALREEIGKSLPKYMIPHIFTHLKKMPMTASGKANRNALPEIDLENINTETEYVAPSTEREIILSGCICDVLNTEKVSILDNFFDIGGDSLKAIELTAKLEEKGFTTAIKTIFSCKDIKELSEKLEAKEKQQNDKIEYGNVISATAAQMRVYTAQMLAADSPLYNVTYAFKAEDVSKDKLERAINMLIERHESLRTHFENRNGQIVQVIDKDVRITVESIDDLNSFSKPFDLGLSPLLRVGCTDNNVVIDMHHIITDGESMPVFFKELNELYMGRDLPETVQYGEFAVTEKYIEDNENYWLDVFKDEVPTLELPTDYPRGAEQSFKGSNIYEQIDIKLHEKIEEKCKERGITPYVYYMACFSALLSKLSGNEDIVVGTPVSGREGRYLDTIGMFVNTIALRSKPEGNKKIYKFFNEIRDTSINAIDNQSYPFGELVKKLGIEVGGRNPIFDVIFAYQSREMTDISFSDKKVDLLPTTTVSSKCDMALSVLPRKDDVVLSIEYCTDLYKEESICKFAQMYMQLLEAYLDDEKYISDISVTDMSLIDSFNQTAHSYNIPDGSTLYSLFEKRAKENSDKICIHTSERDLTFGELLSISKNLDAEIREITQGKKSVIAVIAERSPEMYSAIYGIIRGGNAYLPIDPEYPQERIDYIINNSSASVVLAQEKFIHLAKSIPCINVTEFLRSHSEKYGELPLCAAEPNDTAYVIYTSGSTGNPKGAKVSHKSAVNRILWMHDKYPLCSDGVILQKTPYTFDVSVWEHFWWGICSGSLVASKPGEHFLPAKILDEVYKNKVTHLHFVPSVFELFLNYLELHKEETEKFNSVRYVFLSGEALNANLVQRFYKLYDYSKVSLHNLYGPTECTVDVTYYDCVPEDSDPVPIGKPIYNTQMYVVDKYMKPVPVGVTGELCIAGINVGQGYLNNPDLTAEKFVDNPFGIGKIYKTGDLAYWREDGNIIFCGRIDGQIKLNGQRIEIGEIESVVSAIAEVESIAVTIRKIGQKDVLVAFYAGKQNAEAKIKNHCREKLPKYMVPTFIVQLDAMPLNRSGKLDRRALSEIEVKLCEDEVQGPINDTERYICKVFEDILGEKSIGRNSDFFEIGGTSYSMISLLSGDGFENITAAEFMRNPTPALLASILSKKTAKNTEYLEELYVPEKPTHTLILLPFAGGGAEAYSNLVASIKKQSENTAIYFVRYLHSVEECEKAANEISATLSNTNILVYSHCVGSALALEIIKKLEENYCRVKHYFAGASIPSSASKGKNIWNKVSDKALKTVLSKAGAKLDTLSDEKLTQLLQKFRNDTDFANMSYFKFNGRINTPVTLVLSKKDFFTLNYRQSEKLWNKYANDIRGIYFIDSRNHYFQTTDSNLITDIICKTIR